MSVFDDVLNQKAVALSYNAQERQAPVIVASGMGYTAQKIIDTARENGVPVYEDNSLATVLTQLELGSEIPEELYAAIVDIYVYFLEYGKEKAKPDREKTENEKDGKKTDDEKNGRPA